jgi:two-component system CheB/CheR fusion protein
MQSVNEELQSTNEELETSKEELQSLNEELATVNAELQTKVADLSRANNDMNNLLAGTGIATVYVDHRLRILRFTPTATRIINLILSDVGRPVAHLVSNLVGHDRLVEDVQAVLDSLIPIEVEVQTKVGDWYTMRILPYRTQENVIEGAVITFVDISGAKKAQDALRESRSHFRQVAESLPHPVWMCRADGLSDYLSPQWIEFTGLPEAQQLGFGWLDQIHAEDRGKLMTAWSKAVAAGEPFKVEFRIRHHAGEYHLFDMRATPLRDAEGRIVKWFGMSFDTQEAHSDPRG